MRKSYFILAAAATILASCAENGKITNDLRSDETKTVIGFSSYSEKATRGDASNEANLEYYHGTFTVYGSKISIVDSLVSEVFDGGNTSIITYTDGANTPNEWTYTPYRFWDKQASYKFIAVTPDANIVKYNWDIASNPLVEVGNNDFITNSSYALKGQNLQQDSALLAEIKKGFVGGTKDTDIMTSGLESQAAGNTNTVNLQFKHILSKLNVNVAKAKILNDADIYIKSLEIIGLKDEGTYAESRFHLNDGATDTIPTTSGWTASKSADSANYILAYDYTLDGKYVNTKVGYELADYDTINNKTVPTYFIESLVMPQTVTPTDSVVLLLKYQIVTGTHKEDYTYKFDMSQAFASYLDRHNYTLKLIIEPSVIKFDAKATIWADAGSTEHSVH